MSWMTGLAEKGGHFLNSLDTRVADLLNNNELPQTNPVSKISPRTSVVSSQQATATRNARFLHPKSSHLVSKSRGLPSKHENSILQPSVDREAELFEFLNNPAQLEINAPTPAHKQPSPSALSNNSHNLDVELIAPAKVESPRLADEQEISNITHPHSKTNHEDLVLENRLLHNEVSSLNNEIANLLSRNRKIEEEYQQKVDLLNKELEESNCRIRRMENITSPDSSKNNRTLVSKIELLSNNLKLAQIALDQSEKKAAESLRLAEISTSRADQAQSEASRLSRYLAEYKEKASSILSTKEKFIMDLQKQIDSKASVLVEGVDEEVSTELQCLHEEISLLREEERSWRVEVENRELAFRELEEQMQVEQASLRRTISVLEQQRERDRQVCTASDKEIISLQTKLANQEERMVREKSELHSIIQSNEVELARMRRLVAEGRSGSSSPDSISTNRTSAPPPRSDSEQILALESRLRQLNDSLLTKQDALDATLAQNHGLKIRLARFEADNEVHLLASDIQQKQNFPNGHSQLLSSNRSTYGFARLHLVGTSLPHYFRNAITTLDEVMINLVSFLRRRPLFRLLFIFYLFLVHLWFMLAFFVFSPPLPQTDLIHPNPN